MSEIPEPQPARPWRPETDGPYPRVLTWPGRDRPELEVWSGGEWRAAPVLQRQDWADGTTRYQVDVNLHGGVERTVVTYQWPQPGLRAGRPSGSEPSTTADRDRRRAAPPGRPRTPSQGPPEAGGVQGRG